MMLCSVLWYERTKVCQYLPYVSQNIAECRADQLVVAWPLWRERYVNGCVYLPLEFQMWRRGWSEVANYSAVL